MRLCIDCGNQIEPVYSDRCENCWALLWERRGIRGYSRPRVEALEPRKYDRIMRMRRGEAENGESW